MNGERIEDILRICRERAKLSQQELASRLYIDQAIVSKIENGKLTPSYTLVKNWGRVTDSMDLIEMDMIGSRQGARRYRQMEDLLKDMKRILEPINLMRIRAKGRRKKNATIT